MYGNLRYRFTFQCAIIYARASYFDSPPRAMHRSDFSPLFSSPPQSFETSKFAESFAARSFVREASFSRNEASILFFPRQTRLKHEEYKFFKRDLESANSRKLTFNSDRSTISLRNRYKFACLLKKFYKRNIFICHFYSKLI